MVGVTEVSLILILAIQVIKLISKIKYSKCVVGKK